MPNYENSKIYKLWSPSKNLVYIGSTTQTLAQRLSKHLDTFKKNRSNRSASIVLECGDYKMELLEKYPCNNKQELFIKEGEHIRTNECINKQIAGRTQQQYIEENKEKINKKNKIRRDDDEYREKMKLYFREYRLQQDEKTKEKIKKQEKNYRNTDEFRERQKLYMRQYRLKQKD
jgi:hypothetical protein